MIRGLRPRLPLCTLGPLLLGAFGQCTRRDLRPKGANRGQKLTYTLTDSPEQPSRCLNLQCCNLTHRVQFYTLCNFTQHFWTSYFLAPKCVVIVVSMAYEQIRSDRTVPSYHFTRKAVTVEVEGGKEEAFTYFLVKIIIISWMMNTSNHY